MFSLAHSISSQIRDQERVIFTGKTDAGAGSSGPSCPANTVHIIFRIFRQIVVDHMADTIDMNTPTSNVCGNQYVDFAVLEVLQRLDAFLLWHFSGQLIGLESILLQALSQAAGLVASVGKHNDTVQIITLDQIGQQRIFLFVGNKIQLLVNGVGCNAFRLQFLLSPASRSTVPPIAERHR